MTKAEFLILWEKTELHIGVSDVPQSVFSYHVTPLVSFLTLGRRNEPEILIVHVSTQEQVVITETDSSPAPS